MPHLGLSVAPANDIASSDGKGVVVTAVDPDGPAADQGFQTGDVILDVGGKPVANANDVRKATTEAKGQGKHSVLMRVKTADAITKVGTVVMGNVIQAGNKMNRRGNPTFIVGYRSMFPPCMCVDRWPLFNLTMASPLPVDSF